MKSFFFEKWSRVNTQAQQKGKMEHKTCKYAQINLFRIYYKRDQARDMKFKINFK